MAYALLARLA